MPGFCTALSRLFVAFVSIALLSAHASGQIESLAPSETGPWGVGHQVFSVPSPGASDRLDVWYPVDISHRLRGPEFCSRIVQRLAERNGTLVPDCVQYESEELAVYPEFGEWESQRRSRIAVEDAPVSNGNYPLIIYNHGGQLSSTGFTSMPEALASHGFFVAVHDSYGTFESVEFLIEKATTEDDPFLDRIDIDSLGISGGSAGGTQSIYAAADNSSKFLRVPDDAPRFEALFGLGTHVEDEVQLSIPTLLLLGIGDGFLDFAIEDLGRLPLEEKSLAILPTGHASVMLDGGGSAETRRLVNMFAVSFFTEHLKNDDRYKRILSEQYVWHDEAAEQVFFFDGAVTDATGDWRTGFEDFLVLSQNFGSSTIDMDIELRRTVGDFDLDGAVAFRDFLLLKDNFSGDIVGSQIHATTVPEPGNARCLALTVFISCTVVYRRRRR